MRMGWGGCKCRIEPSRVTTPGIADAFLASKVRILSPYHWCFMRARRPRSQGFATLTAKLRNQSFRDIDSKTSISIDKSLVPLPRPTMALMCCMVTEAAGAAPP